MAEILTWNQPENKQYELGLDKGVLFVRYPDGSYPLGVSWEGLINITEKPAGAESTDLYANNIKYASMRSTETFEFTIEAYTYPKDWEQCDGAAELGAGVLVRQQSRKAFGMAYRSQIGSDAGGDNIGYKLHLVYGAKAKPSETALATIGESPEATTMSWDCETTPVNVGAGYKPTALVTFNSLDTDPSLLAWIEEQLYGSDSLPIVAPNLPTPEDIVAYIATM